MFLKLFAGTTQFAPVQRDEALNVIDLSVGTGTWATAFADLYHLSSVLGIDLSPIQSNWVPPNLDSSNWCIEQSTIPFVELGPKAKHIYVWQCVGQPCNIKRF
ncbi:hypothetical protein GQ44DRAFT_779931 [Phaeosphaeriaceae sp. PMI808]|nr:hypothetical protein GQ44DRAFT_779931 [Phaeosphaeriaceae sp. PMI808]